MHKFHMVPYLQEILEVSRVHTDITLQVENLELQIVK